MGGYKKQITFLLIVLLVFTLLFVQVVSALTFANLTFLNGSSPDQIYYNRAGTVLNTTQYGNITYGSNSYTDYNPTTNNLFLNICYPNLSTQQKIDIAYTTENSSLLGSVLYYLPQITFVENRTINGETGPCTTVDVSLAGGRMIYPGYLNPILVYENSSYKQNTVYNSSDIHLFSRFPILFNGSFDVQVNVEGPPKIYYFAVQQAYDEKGVKIDRKDDYLLTSLLDVNNESLSQGRVKLQEGIPYTHEIVGGESVWVNGIRSLNIIAYNPCDPINQSGYYILNQSSWNTNKSCIVINQTNDLVLNFGDEIVDGDNEENGSMAEGQCTVTIVDSSNVTIENFNGQQFFYGFCITNSSVRVFGNSDAANLNGALIEDNSQVDFIDMSFNNNHTEILSYNNSLVRFLDVNISNARLESNFTDVRVQSINKLPEPIGIDGLYDINQYVLYKNTSENGWAHISFYYEEPLPNNVGTDNISIYKYDMKNTSYTEVRYNISFNATTNSTTNVSYNVTLYNISGNWTKVYTLVSPSQHLIMSSLVENFSVFAPFGEKAPENPVPDPVPVPVPTPDPQSGESSGQGGTPNVPNYVPIATAVPEPLILDLVLPNNITLMQGEAGEVFFNLTNKGDSDAPKLVVGPSPRNGWDYTNTSIPDLTAGETLTSSFQIAPYIKETVGKYIVPVRVYLPDKDGAKLLTEIMTINVIPRGDLSRLKVLEYPPEVVYKPNSKMNIAFLVENIGDKVLGNVSLKYDDPKGCIKSIKGIDSLDWRETKSFVYNFKLGQANTCDVNLKFYSGADLIGFLPMTFTSKTKNAFLELPLGTRSIAIIIIILVIWSILTIFVLERSRKRVK